MKKEVVKVDIKQLIDKQTMKRIDKAIGVIVHLQDALAEISGMFHYPSEWDNNSPKQIEAKLKRISTLAAKFNALNL